MIRGTNTSIRAALVALTLLGALLVPLTAVGSAGAAPVSCPGQIATIVGTNGKDVVDAKAGDDEVTTYDPGDDLEGDLGTDLLDLRQFSSAVQLD